MIRPTVDFQRRRRLRRLVGRRSALADPPLHSRVVVSGRALFFAGCQTASQRFVVLIRPSMRFLDVGIRRNPTLSPQSLGTARRGKNGVCSARNRRRRDPGHACLSVCLSVCMSVLSRTVYRIVDESRVNARRRGRCLVLFEEGHRLSRVAREGGAGIRLARRTRSLQVQPQPAVTLSTHYFFLLAVTLNLKKMTSPSSTVYPLPSCRYFPAAFTADSVPSSLSSSKCITSAQMNPRSKSV